MIYCKDELDLLQDEKKYQETYQRFDSIVRCNGWDEETGRELSMRDVMELQSAAFMIPRVLTNFVQEGVEPLLIGTRLLQRIEYTPGMATVYPAVDILEAREVGDQMALPIFNVNIGGSQSQGISVKRHGLALRVSNKFTDQSSYPWLQWWMRMAGNALARHKESIIWSYISNLGLSIFDNDVAARTDGSPLQPARGVTTGRNLFGTFNGSITMDDIHTMWTTLLLQGYMPDTLLVHPLTFLTFVRDKDMREFAMSAGGGSFFQNWAGNAVSQSFKGQHNFNGLAQGNGQTGKYVNGKLVGGQRSTVEGVPQDLTSAPVLPSYLGMSFRILVSPFCKFNVLTQTADILMFDSRNLGALVVAEDPHVRHWQEPGYNINNIGIEETYGLALLNEGQAVGSARNVACKANEFALPARPTVTIGDGAGYQDKDSAGFAEFGASPTNILPTYA